MVDLVVQAGQSRENFVLDAVGPDVFNFEEMVRLLASILDRRVIITHVPPDLGFALARVIEPFIRDVLITRDEIAGLMANLLISRQTPTGTTRLEDWLRTHIEGV